MLKKILLLAVGIVIGALVTSTLFLIGIDAIGYHDTAMYAVGILGTGVYVILG